MGTNLRVLFYAKKKVKTIKGTTPIYLRITIDGQRFETSIHRQIATDNWIAKLGKAKGITEDVKILNAHLETL
ncbi:MAG TPA: Arm DNA-binding domain-containing protein, partial [Puia sp.]